MFAKFLWIIAAFELISCGGQEKNSSRSPITTDEICDTLTTANLTALSLDSRKSAFLTKSETIISDLFPAPIEPHIITDSYIDGVGSQHIDFSFSINSVPLCQFYSRVHSLNDETIVTGKLPKNLPLKHIPTQWQSTNNEQQLIMDSLELKGTAKVLSKKECLVWDKGNLKAGFELDFTVNNLPYYGLVADNQVIKSEARFFDVVTEQAKVYERTTSTNTITVKTITLPGMSDGGSLCSARFRTVVPSNVTQAFATNASFDFPTTDQRFKETSIFTNITTQSNWFLSLGILKAWPGPKIDLFMDGTNNFKNNTSVYLPQTNSSNPTIKLGAGDNKDLQNLYFDYDVVSHELGHHIVYRTLKTTSGESLVLHEGLADFFVFSNTKDPCLGRLICPSTGSLCYSSACLRTGLFPLSLTDSSLPVQAHKRSQFISSLLWDLGNGNTKFGVTNIGLEVITKDTLKAIEFFPQDAGYAAFIKSLMQADKVLYKSANCSAIQAAALSRGMGNSLAAENVDCKNI